MIATVACRSTAVREWDGGRPGNAGCEPAPTVRRVIASISAAICLSRRPASTRRANEVDPIGRNGFDPFLAAGHEGERPKRMAIPIGAGGKKAFRSDGVDRGEERGVWACEK